MRTTLDIDEDILRVAKDLAKQRSQSLGKVISSLAREGLRPPEPKFRTRNGFPLLERTGSDPVTMEIVRSLMEDEV